MLLSYRNNTYMRMCICLNNIKGNDLMKKDHKDTEKVATMLKSNSNEDSIFIDNLIYDSYEEYLNNYKFN